MIVSYTYLEFADLCFSHLLHELGMYWNKPLGCLHDFCIFSWKWKSIVHFSCEILTQILHGI